MNESIKKTNDSRNTWQIRDAKQTSIKVHDEWDKINEWWMNVYKCTWIINDEWRNDKWMTLRTHDKWWTNNYKRTQWLRDNVQEGMINKWLQKHMTNKWL